jgi:hypothetical protein
MTCLNEPGWTIRDVGRERMRTGKEIVRKAADYRPVFEYSPCLYESLLEPTAYREMVKGDIYVEPLFILVHVTMAL